MTFLFCQEAFESRKQNRRPSQEAARLQGKIRQKNGSEKGRQAPHRSRRCQKDRHRAGIQAKIYPKTTNINQMLEVNSTKEVLVIYIC